MVEVATVDSNDESDQVMGRHSMLVEHLELPFETSVLGVEVTVRSLEIAARWTSAGVARKPTTGSADQPA